MNETIEWSDLMVDGTPSSEEFAGWPEGARGAVLLLLPLLGLAALAGVASRLPVVPNAARIVLGTPVLVNGDRPDVPHVEPFLAAHPSKPDLLFGAAVTFPVADPKLGIDISSVTGFRSLDGGRSWGRVGLPGCRVDPWVSFGSGDDLYVACLGRDSSVLVLRSPDAGRTWAEAVRVPAGGGGGVDKPTVNVDRSATPRRGTVYVAFGQYFPTVGLRQRMMFGSAVAASTDGGRSFAPPHFIAHDNLDQQPLDAAVLSTGDLVLFFQDYARQGELLAHRRIWAASSADGARSFSTPALVFEQRDHEMPWALAADPSGRHRDRLYLAVLGFWQRSGGRPLASQPKGPSDLYVIASDDRGESWGPPAAVIPPPAGGNAQTPAIAVNRDGVVGVAWYDTSRDPAGACFDIELSASLDGGASFLPPARVTPEPSCLRASERQQGLARRYAFGGDYSGLAAGADGQFHLFWADSRSGVYQIMAATARVVP